MKLVLAEKPSVAQSFAKVLGATKREDGYLEGNGYIVSWCVGHLVELAQPEAYDAKYSKWAYADLPIFPADWQYEVSSGTKKQFGILKRLMAREDVASLVCATDAGREGELIFRLVSHKAGCRKPFERLWISSMEDVAIKEGFENLRSGTEYDALYEAALCRERADWIVGINATRLFSTLYGQTLNVGRVMTPTLAMAVMREAAIAAFKPEPFYTVQIGLDGFTASSERYKKKAEAEAASKGCSVVTVTKAERNEKSEKPPSLYDLTSLQRDANIHGFEADIKTVEAHPQISEGFCGMDIRGKHYAEKADAGEWILAACKEVKGSDPVPLGSYRGFQMELSFDSFRHEYDITLKGSMSHRVALGTDARGNITRLDNALAGITERLERANEQLTNLYNQQEATKGELGKPFPQEAELMAKSQRLAELDAALNMEDTVESRAEKKSTERPSVLADLKSKAEHIPPAKRSEAHEEVL